MRTLLAVLVTVAVAPTFAQQAAPAPTMLTLRGVVVTATDVPLARVRVAFVPPDVLPATVAALPELERAVLTDDRGQFTISVPAATAVRLSITKARYAAHSAAVSQRELNTQGSEIRVRMSLAGAISGLVFDRSGARVMLATVTLRRVGAASTDAPISTDTNDLGEFRFGGLAEGTYAITARSSVFALNGPFAEREAAVNAAAAQGPTVSVGRGDEVGNISLTIDPPSELVQSIAGVPNADPEATGSLSGRVVNLDGLPIVRAVVRAMRQGMAVRNVETDTRGRYVIGRLVSGDYIVEAQKYGYINRQYGQDHTAVAGRRVSVQKGQAVDAIDVTLGRGGAIAGTIVDEFGEPVQGARISAYQLQPVAGRTRALRASTLGSSYRTDDRGEYRLFPLQPGTYVVQATISDTLAAASGYLPQFYPGTPSIDSATATKVDLGAAATGIDLTLIPTAAHRVTGIVLDSSGKPARVSLLLAVSERSGAIQTEPVRTSTNPADGSFVFTNVGPGDYVVQANGSVLTTRSGAAVTMSGRLFATSFVTVTAGDPPPIQLKLSAGATLLGRVRYEGVPAGPPPNLTLTALPTDFDHGPLMGAGLVGFSIQPDGSFEYKGVFGPTLLLAQPQQTDWYLKSVLFKGQDLTDSPFGFGTGGTFGDIEVLISAFGAAATGRVTDDRAAPVRDYSVLLFSTVRDKWFAGSRWVKTARASQDGTFSVVGLPPGDYWIAAIERVDAPVGGATLPPDSALLETLSSRATHITLGEGQSQDLTLRLIHR